ncbi:hypothetical protein HF521_017772, partial [Silurus meridionalis]
SWITSCGWNESALLSIYRLGLNPEFRQAMDVHEDSVGLESFIQKSIGLSQRLATCHPTELQPECLQGATAVPEPEPMQLGLQRLSRRERNRRLATGRCLYCRLQGHSITRCPTRPVCAAVSTVEFPTDISPLSKLTVSLLTPALSISVPALAGNFISQACLDCLCLPRERGSQNLAVQTIQGHPLGKGWVKYCTPVATLQVGLFHREEIRFLVLQSSTVSVILGRP